MSIAETLPPPGAYELRRNGLPCDFYDLLTARLVTVPVCYLSEIVKFTEFLLLGATTTDSSQVFGWLKTTL